MSDYNKSNNSEAPDFEDHDALSFDIEEDEVFSFADYRFEDWLAFVIFWFLATTLFSQFLSRYVFSSPLGWTEELARYQLVALGFIGACMGVRKNTHIFVSLFHRWFSSGLSAAIYKLIGACNLLFLVLLAYFSWQIIPLIHIHKMASLDVPVSVLYGVVFGGLLIMIFRASQHLIQLFRSEQDSSSDNSSQSVD